MNLFHISIAVEDLDKTIEFYHEILGCPIGRRNSNWVDLDFFGHQLTAQLSPNNVTPMDTTWRGERMFPVRHFGIVMRLKQWIELRDKLENSEIPWLIEPTTYYKGHINEQDSFFVKDPNGYAIEFKTFGADFNKVFSKN